MSATAAVPSRTSLAVALLLGFASMLAAPQPLDAQERASGPRILSGLVLDAESGGAVPGALVVVGGRDRGTFTDAQGRFSLRGVRPGSHPVLVAQLGYDSLTTSLEVTEDMGQVVLRLRPNPVILEGISVVSDRLRSRRNAVATSVWAFDQNALRTSSARSALEFIQTRASLHRTPCVNRLSVASCAYVRGRPTPVAVYVDDAPVFGGLDMLDSYQPEELYLVEVYSGGRQIRAYTNWYIGWAARTGRRPSPVLIW